jgi:hypothetical protein
MATKAPPNAADEAFVVLMRATEQRRQLQRFGLWYAWWSDIACDLAALGVANETIMRVREQLLGLSHVVQVVSGGDGGKVEQPPTI